MSPSPDPYSSHRWQLLRREILLRDHYVCQLCGDPIDAALSGHHSRGPSVDHIVPTSRGGAMFDPGNLRAVHNACNTGRELKLRARDRRRYPPRRQW